MPQSATIAFPSGASGLLDPVAHGDELTVAHVGPWALQDVSKGSESLTAVSTPGRGYFRIDTPSEFAPTSDYVYDNSTSNTGGVVPAGGMTIDGYAVPAGTIVAQFRSFASPDFYGGGNKVLFRGCKFSSTAWSDGTGLFNDSTAAAGWQAMVHFCQFYNPDEAESVHGGPYAKHIAGSNHRYYRNLAQWTATAFQPNTTGCVLVENYIDNLVFPWGESGTSGSFDSTVLHLNGISIEGGLSSLEIRRNHILVPSPDGCTGTKGTTAGQAGYGTQSGQTGYGSGTNPGRLVTQTDCIALFTSNGTQWNLGSAGAVAVTDNYIGGSGACLYVEGTPQNVTVTSNTVTTKWWTNGGNFGPNSFGTFSNGSNGCVITGNLWADDYGTGGNGCTLLADRQYPTGNGARAGTTVF